jgi:hypothetical protein
MHHACVRVQPLLGGLTQNRCEQAKGFEPATSWSRNAGPKNPMLCLVSLGGRTTILLSPKLYLELYQPKTVSKGWRLRKG